MKKYHYVVPLLNLENGSGVLLLNFEGGPGRRTRVPRFRVLGPVSHHRLNNYNLTPHLVSNSFNHMVKNKKKGKSGNVIILHFCYFLHNYYIKASMSNIFTLDLNKKTDISSQYDTLQVTEEH